MDVTVLGGVHMDVAAVQKILEQSGSISSETRHTETRRQRKLERKKQRESGKARERERERERRWTRAEGLLLFLFKEDFLGKEFQFKLSGNEVHCTNASP